MGTLAAITGAIQQYVVAPSASFGLAGYVFNVQGENIAHLSADVTDHYTEDNKAIQDHVAIRPKRMVLKGYVGELVYSNDPFVPQGLAKVTAKLISVSTFAPALSAAATQIRNAITSDAPITFGSALNAASNIYGIVKNSLGAFGNMKNQQNAFNYFQALMESATLISVQTPWKFISSMVIESMTAVQDEKTTFVSEFSLTLKEIRIAQTLSLAFILAGTGGTVPPGGVAYQGDAALQAQPVTNLGATQGAVVNATITSYFNKFNGIN